MESIRMTHGRHHIETQKASEAGYLEGFTITQTSIISFDPE
jgi:hypothetical protein